MGIGTQKQEFGAVGCIASDSTSDLTTSLKVVAMTSFQPVSGNYKLKPFIYFAETKVICSVVPVFSFQGIQKLAAHLRVLESCSMVWLTPQ